MSVDELASIQSIILLYSNYSVFCHQLLSSISDKQRSRYRPICVDNQAIRDILPIKQVPCAVVIYVDGQVARYEGASSMDLIAHLTMLFNQVEKMSTKNTPPPTMRNGKSFLDETEKIQESHAGQGAGSTPISSLLKAPPNGQSGREAFAPDDFLGNGPRQSVGKPMEFRDVNQDSRPIDLPRTTTKINVSSIMNEFDNQGDVQESPQRGKVRKTNTEGMQSERTMTISPSRKGEGHAMMGISSLNMIEKQTTPPPDEKIHNAESLGGEDLDDLLTLDTTLDREIQDNIGKKGKDANSKQRSEEMIRQREELEQKINNAR
jgi:hypothetical protein